MLSSYRNHNLFLESPATFARNDPHLRALAQLKYQYSPEWWQNLTEPGIYILTGGRQVGKSTSCKLLIKNTLQNEKILPQNIFYLPCDEIYDAKELSQVLRFFLEQTDNKPYLLIIDEVTYVPNWDRVIKSLADEGYFTHGICILTGSDTIILKEAAMRFPGRRGYSATTDFHLYPLTFSEYVQLIHPDSKPTEQQLDNFFHHYLITGGYLRAINDFATHGEILPATYITYEQWIRGDFLKQGKNEDYLLALLHGLLTVGVSQISFSSLTQKIGLMSKETCIRYLRLLERMDILFDLQAFDQNKKQGFPRKDRKLHFFDPFILRTIHAWLIREGYLNSINLETNLIESTVASHCYRKDKTYYFKGVGEIDIIWLHQKKVQAIEVKWSRQLRATDLKTLKQFKNCIILGQGPRTGMIDHVEVLPVYQFLISI